MNKTETFHRLHHGKEPFGGATPRGVGCAGAGGGGGFWA